MKLIHDKIERIKTKKYDPIFDVLENESKKYRDFVKMIKKCYNDTHHIDEEHTDIRYLVELPMTKEQYDYFMSFMK